MTDPQREPKTVPCPTCNKPVAWTAASIWRPFCCERCRMIDLGEWLGEDKRIPGDPAPPAPEEWAD